MAKRPQRAGYLQNGGLSLGVFTQAELEAIHLATLEVLSETGVNVQSDRAREIYAAGGARVNNETWQVTFPPKMVQAAIDSAPPQFIAHGRRKEDDAILDSTRVAYTSFTEGVEIFDLDTGEIRDTTIKDLALLTHVCDSMDIIDVVCSIVNGGDVPQELNGLYNAATVLLNTTKHFDCGPNTAKEADYIYRIAEAIVGPENMPHRSPVNFGGCPISPLRLAPDMTDILIYTAEKKLPCEILSMAMSGGTAPANLAGTLVVHNAEVLSAIILTQLVTPGTPVLYGTSTTAMNLKTATATVGSPELALISAAVAAIARYYQIPSMAAGT